MQKDLIFPMALYVFFMWLSAVHMFRVRVQALRAGKTSLKFYRAQLGEAPPEAVVVVGRHYDNQFQVPILFLLTCLAQMQMAQVNRLTISLAWLFVLSRGVHSWILLRRNNVRHRVKAFAFGWFVLLALWAQLLYFAL